LTEINKNKLSDKKLIIFFTIVLAVITFTIYFNSLSNKFVFDDKVIISENNFIKNISNIKNLFVPKEYFAQTNEFSYRPIATISYFINYFIWKNNPYGFHLSNIVFHIFNVLLIFFISNKIFKKEVYSFIAAIIFAVHPAISETVLCASYNEDLLACFFFLLAFLIYLNNNKNSLFLSSLFFFIALLSKEMALTFPVIIFVYELIFSEENKKNKMTISKKISNFFRNKKNYIFSYCLTVLLFLLLRFIIFNNPSHLESDSGSNIFERLIFIPYNLLQFIKIIFVPVNLSADYYFSYPQSFFNLENIVSYILFISILISLYFIYRYNKIITFGILWFLLTLLPVLNIILIYNPVAERYLYIPAVGFSFIIAGIFSIYEPRIENRNFKFSYIIKCILIISIFIFYSTILNSRIKDWKDDEHLWNNTIKVNPKSYFAYNELGLQYFKKGEIEKSIDMFEKAKIIKPEFDVTYYNLGSVYFSQNRFDNAIINFKKAIDLNDKNPLYFNNLGSSYFQLNNFEEAVKQYQKAVELNSNFIDALKNLIISYKKLGQIYKNQGKYKEATEIWNSALQILPDDQELIENINETKNLLK
jgi:protein O-mannosyl-transferase